MKKSSLLTLAMASAIYSFAIEPTISFPLESAETKKVRKEKSFFSLLPEEKSKGMIYVKMQVASKNETNAPWPKSMWSKKNSFLPGVGIGYRKGLASAVDISISQSFKEGRKDETIIFSAFPKMAYLEYLSPHKQSSFYYGAGIIWGSLKALNEKNPQFFLGLIPVACIGYEYNHSQQDIWCSFFEFEIKRPLISIVRKGSIARTFAELSIGLGY